MLGLLQFIVFLHFCGILLELCLPSLKLFILLFELFNFVDILFFYIVGEPQLVFERNNLRVNFDIFLPELFVMIL
jgi:hypothetical protein